MLTTVAIRTLRDRARRRLRRGAVERRGVALLTHDAVRAGRVDRPQDRADVLRILDAVEHDEERRAGRRRRDEIADRVVARRVDVGDHALMHAAARRALERRDVDPLDRHASLPRERDRFLDAPIGAGADPQLPHASGAQRLHHGVHAVHDHGPSPQAAREHLGALAAADHRRDARRARELRAAIDRRHREIELRSARFARQRDANRMEQRAPLLPGPLLHPVRRRAKRVAVEAPRVAQLLGQRADDVARAVRLHDLRDIRPGERRRRIEIEEKPQAIRDLLETIDRRHRHRKDLRHELHRFVGPARDVAGAR